MNIEGWKYYNYAAIPTCAPDENPDLTPIKKGTIWRLGGAKTLFARWTSDWDCGYETEWWYVIKDTPFDPSTLKSKRRYEITKGNRYFDVRKINPGEYFEDICRVTIAAYSGWPKKYRPHIDERRMLKFVDDWSQWSVFGAFSKDDGLLQSYAVMEDYYSYASFSVLRTNPKMEKLAVNAAMIDGILDFYNERLKNEFYICDGSRVIRHETAFQDYLEKYFSFRKAYCKLNVIYKRGIGIAVKILYP